MSDAVALALGVMSLLGTLSTALLALFGKGLAKAVEDQGKNQAAALAVSAAAQAETNRLITQLLTRDLVSEERASAVVRTIEHKLGNIQHIVTDLHQALTAGTMSAMAKAIEHLASAMEGANRA